MSFGSGGIATTSIAVGSGASDVLVQPDAKIVAGGYAAFPPASPHGFLTYRPALVRYLGSTEPPPPPPPPATCLVPEVRGRPLKEAKAKILRANCTVGKITRAYSRKKKARVIDQRPRPGTELTAGAPVRLVVSRGPRPG